MTISPPVPQRGPTPELGPAMRAISPRWQAAVEALFLCNGRQAEALRIAGYVGTPQSIDVMASRLFGDDRVRAAIREECRKRIDITEPELITTVRSILRNPEAKDADRLKAASMFWDRSNPVENKLKINVEHHVTDAERDVKHYYALKKLGGPHEAFIARFGPHGIARVEAMILAEEAKRREIEGSATTIDASYQKIVPAFEEPTEPVPEIFDEEFLEELL
jgi:hypothetical protein